MIDTGVGVPPDQLERIWDRFHQADSSTRRQFGGTGLGLAIVRHLVELHGGTVAVSSDGPGSGSTFSFSDAAGRGAAVSHLADGCPSPSSAPSPARRRTVLIVDDEPDNREVITSIVHDVMGHAAITAANGAEALTRAQRAGPGAAGPSDAGPERLRRGAGPQARSRRRRRSRSSRSPRLTPKTTARGAGGWLHRLRHQAVQRGVADHGGRERAGALRTRASALTRVSALIP